MNQSLPLNPLGRDLIAQIRRDLAAAWEHVEAGRAILSRSAWLLARWREQTAAGEPSLVPAPGRVSMAGMFVEIEEERPRRRRPRRAFADAAG
jgi:hypothetical protein